MRRDLDLVATAAIGVLVYAAMVASVWTAPKVTLSGGLFLTAAMTGFALWPTGHWLDALRERRRLRAIEEEIAEAMKTARIIIEPIGGDRS